MNANELIELLDRNSGDGDTRIRQAVILLRQQQAEIEALKYQVREMTAVITILGDEREALKAKTLTDEEILKEWTWKYSDCFEDFLLQFARAILRKAQEK